MADCPVDANNLSFSDDEYSSLFITQSTFCAVDTQDVVEAVDFLDNLGNFSSGDSPKSEQHGEEHVQLVLEYDWREHKDIQYFNFCGDVDNGCDVTTSDTGYIVKSPADGSEIFVFDKDVKQNEVLPGDSSTNSEVSYSTHPLMM